MYFLELAASGARGLTSGARVSLKPGYVVLTPPDGAELGLAATLAAILYPDGRGGDAALLAAGQKVGKVALTLVGADQTTYRMVRELGSVGALQRVNKTTLKFEVVTDSAADMIQFLRSQAGLPTKTAFEHLFAFNGQQLPSRRPAAVAGKGAVARASSPPGLDGVPAAPVGSVRELEAELALAAQVEKLQARNDEISSELFELESKLKQGEALRGALRDAGSLIERAPTPKSLRLPDDIAQRCGEYRELVEKRDAAIAALGPAEEESFTPLPSAVEALHRRPQFWAGVVAGAAVLVLGFFLRSIKGYLGYVALLDIPAFGYAGFIALQYVDDLRDSQKTARKGGMREAREKRIVQEFEAEAAVVKQAMAALHVESPDEVVTALGRRAQCEEKAQSIRTQLDELEQDAEYASAKEREAELRSEQEQINAKLLEQGGYIRDVREIRRDLDRARGGSSTVARAPSASSTGSGAAVADPGPALLKLAADVARTDVPSLFAAVKDRAAQYVAALSGKQYTGIEADKDGKLSLVASGETTPCTELPGEAVDLAYLALKLTLVEKLSRTSKVPLIFDGGWAPFDESKTALIAKMLKHLGSLTQVLHVTNEPAFAQAADINANL